MMIRSRCTPSSTLPFWSVRRISSTCTNTKSASSFQRSSSTNPKSSNWNIIFAKSYPAIPSTFRIGERCPSSSKARRDSLSSCSTPNRSSWDRRISSRIHDYMELISSVKNKFSESIAKETSYNSSYRLESSRKSKFSIALYSSTGGQNKSSKPGSSETPTKNKMLSWSSSMRSKKSSNQKETSSSESSNTLEA